jgi:hypothetical protein
MSALNNSLLLGQEGGGGYAISRSLRFNSSDSAYLSRTPASAGNRKTWTWAGWVKRSALGSAGTIFAGDTGSNTTETFLFFNSSNQFVVVTALTNALVTSAVFRDASAWYHIVVAFDTTQATAANRVKLYVNGVEVTAFASTNYPSQNSDWAINNTVAHSIGRVNGVNYFSGYLADIHFIDGQALDPTSFGEFDDNGIWQPKAYTGSYGTNGFHLDFADNSTAAALGTDSSGAGNTWTVNNISVGGITYSSATNGNTPVYDIQIGPTNDLSGTYVWSNAFDANGSTIGLIGPITFINTKPTWSTSAGVQVMAAGNGITATVNGGSQVACTNGGWTTISTGSSGTLDSIWVYGATGASYFYGVRVDGVEIAVRRQINDNVNNDSLVDVPTNGAQTDTGAGGEVRGNYCTLNPLTSLGGTYSQGNLRFVGPSAYRRSNGTIAVSTGKWYWEVTLANDPYSPRSNTTQWNAFGFGVSSVSQSTTSLGSVTDAVILNDSGYYKNFSGSVTDVGTAFSSGDVLSCAVDLDANTFTFRRNNTQVATGTIGGTAGRELAPIIISYDSQYGVMDCNFGQRPFAYPVAGYKSLNTASLPAPVVTKPNTVFDTVLWTGNNTGQTITMPGAFSPDLVWTKMRSEANAHWLFDVVRGTNQGLSSSSTTNELTRSSSVTAFGSTGFTLGTSADVNSSAYTYVAWTWDAGSSTVTNTQGSISSQVRANPSAGFSIVTYTGTGGTGTVGHGLGVTPSMIIVKNRTNSAAWVVQHKGTGTNRALKLNTTDSTDTVGFVGLDSSNFTSTTFTVNYSDTNTNIVNASSNNYVAYCFAPVNNFSSFGFYQGNGSADGPFVFCGFRPRYILRKRTDTSGPSWRVIDAARNPYNLANEILEPNTSDATENNNEIDILSNGFKIRSADTDGNASGGTIIYAAFAESPFQYARAR